MTSHELPGDLLVVVPDELAPAFRLSGARTVEVKGAGASRRASGADAPGNRPFKAVAPQDVPGLVAAEIAAGRPGVIGIHPELWQQVPESVRQGWEERLVPLVVALPADTGTAAPSRRHAVRELLARSVGYEITFSGGRS